MSITTTGISGTLTGRHIESNSKDEHLWIDALPYIDSIDDNYERKAVSLVNKEMHVAHSTKSLNALSIPDELVLKTNIMKNGYDMLAQSLQSKDEAKLLRQEMKGKIEPNRNSVELKEEIDRLRAMFEAERLRSVQLEIDKEGPGNSSIGFKAFNENVLSSIHKTLDEEVKKRKVAIDDINFERQKKQQTFGQQLDLLNNKLSDFINQHYQLRDATRTLESEIKSMNDKGKDVIS